MCVSKTVKKTDTLSDKETPEGVRFDRTLGDICAVFPEPLVCVAFQLPKSRSGMSRDGLVAPDGAPTAFCSGSTLKGGMTRFRASIEATEPMSAKVLIGPSAPKMGG